jgi:hypothetical protein
MLSESPALQGGAGGSCLRRGSGRRYASQE